MKRILTSSLYTFVGFTLLLTSCGGAPSATATPNVILPTNIIVPTQPACVTIASEPTPGPEAASLFPSVTATDYTRGPADAPITLIDYSDYQDPRSAEYAHAALQLYNENPDRVRLVTRPFPIFVVNDKAAYAALAAEAAAEQGKFWQMHDLLFAQQPTWINLSVDDFKQWIVDQLPALELNVEQFRSDYAREDIIAKVQQAWENGTQIGLPGTPVVVINGEQYQGPRDYNSLNAIAQLIILGERQFSTCPPMTVDVNKQYIATLKTEKGDIVIELFPDKAPVTVNSFLFLVRNGWYDNITFHRVIPEVYAQTGDPSGAGKGNPGYYLVTEIVPEVNFEKPGMVAMVNSGPDTSGSQFFITTAPATAYNGLYTIFGQILQGMDVLKALTPRDVQPGAIATPGDKLISITIEER